MAHGSTLVYRALGVLVVSAAYQRPMRVRRISPGGAWRYEDEPGRWRVGPTTWGDWW